MKIGINITGFGYIPGSNIFVTQNETDYFVANGFEVLRISLSWESLQSVAFANLNWNYLQELEAAVNYATGLGMDVILDLHNYGSYQGNLIGSMDLPASALVDVWRRLSDVFATNAHVIFGLMNEPQVTDQPMWLLAINETIAAIRATGAVKQEILVPGLGWDGADTWLTNGNAATLGNQGAIKDSSANFAFDLHQYLDEGGAGQTTKVASPNIGVDRLKAVTSWAKATGAKLFLSETGVGSEATSTAALGNMLDYMQANQDVWQGMSYWAAGRSWNNYIYGVEPAYGLLDKAQMVPLITFGASNTTTTDLAGGGSERKISQGAGRPSLVEVLGQGGILVSRTLYAADGSVERALTRTANGTIQLLIADDLPDGIRSRIETYTADGAVLAQTDVAVDGSRTVLSYSPTGELAEKDEYAADGSRINTLFEVDDATHLILQWNEDGGSVAQLFDANWSLLTQTTSNAAGQTTSVMTPQFNGNNLIVIYTPGSIMANEFDQFSGNWQLLSRTLAQPDGGWITWDYTSVAGVTIIADDLRQPPASLATASGNDWLVLRLSEDSWLGDAQFTATIDGQALGPAQFVTSSHGHEESFVFQGSFGSGPHILAVAFTNDAWGNASGMDRNLYLEGATFNGVDIQSAQAPFYSNMTKNFGIAGSDVDSASPTGTDVLTLYLSEDAWQGDALFTASLDGKSLGPSQLVTSSHGLGQNEAFTFHGNFGSDPHDLVVSFINDAWGGSDITDRNLFVDNAVLNGANWLPITSSLYQNGSITLHTPF
jgi:aryl-phospho-beta-D-glucosidase BglC (GH1 family)